ASGPGRGRRWRRPFRGRFEGHESARRPGRPGGAVGRRPHRGRAVEGGGPVAAGRRDAVPGRRGGAGRGRPRDRCAVRGDRARPQGRGHRGGGGAGPGAGPARRDGHPGAGVRQPGHVPRLRGTGRPVRRRGPDPGVCPQPGWGLTMASRAVAVPSDRHLRVVTEREAAGPTARLWQRIRNRERTRNPTVVLVLLGATAVLTGIGLVMVLSASSVSAYAQYGTSFLFFKRQAVYVVVGTVALLLTSRVRYRTWQRLAVPLMVVALALLVVVLHPAVGTVAGGSARWIAFGPVTVQPSEIAKL